jgi:hypothetical protein
MSLRPRIALALPVVAECHLVEQRLSEDGYEPFRLPPHASLIEPLQTRAYDLLVVDLGLAMSAINIVRARSGQVPIIVIGPPGAGAEAQVLARGGVYVARPLDLALFACTVSMAIMDSRPVRRSPRKRAQLGAVVQGIASQIVDVSKEGLRVQIPRTGRVGPPPPVFDVAVPMLGVAVNVRRLWTAASPQSGGVVTWYGGELSHNSLRVQRAWTTLVEALPGAHARLDLG